MRRFLVFWLVVLGLTTLVGVAPARASGTFSKAGPGPCASFAGFIDNDPLVTAAIDWHVSQNCAAVSLRYQQVDGYVYWLNVNTPVLIDHQLSWTGPFDPPDNGVNTAVGNVFSVNTASYDGNCNYYYVHVVATMTKANGTVKTDQGDTSMICSGFKPYGY